MYAECLKHFFTVGLMYRKLSPFEGKQAGGIIKGVVGIVELENGKVKTTLPQNIQFLDNYVKEYDFPEPEELKTEGNS